VGLISRISWSSLLLAVGVSGCLTQDDGRSQSTLPRVPAISPDGAPVPLVWIKEPGIRLDLDPSDPAGTVGLHAPYVHRFPDGTLRMYYDTFGSDPREMRSAASVDGITWTREPGVRLSADDVGDGFGHAHIVAFSGLFRMYYETLNDVESAVSTDGLHWELEPGPRIDAGRDPVVVPKEIGYRMYFRTPGNVHTLQSATSIDGLTWIRDSGIRIANAREFTAFRLPDGVVVIYYADGTPGFTKILSARSTDGLTFATDPGARLLPGNHPDSDPLESGSILTTSLLEFPGGIFRMYYQGAPTPMINEDARVFSAVALLPAIPVRVDIRPGACPNRFNPRSHGVIPAAVLGASEFDARAVDLSSVALEGVPLQHARIVDSSRPGEAGGDCPCELPGPDGFDDLIGTFDAARLADALGSVIPGEVRELTLSGNLQDGTAFRGTDCVVIVGDLDDDPESDTASPDG